MPRRVLFLLLAILLTSVLVTEVRHQNRQHFARLQVLQGERDALNIEWGKLLLEEGTWAQHRRIEMMARTRLDMNIPGRDRISVVHSSSPVKTP